ncbi:PepSY domain-containing protein [Nocardia sp. IFM 10818]
MTAINHRGTVRRCAFGAVLAAAALGVGAGPALAAPAAQPVVNDQQAMEMARDALMGATVQSVELDMADGSPAWEIDLRTRTGTDYEVEVDAMTGMVISIEESAA